MVYRLFPSRQCFMREANDCQEEFKELIAATASVAQIPEPRLRFEGCDKSGAMRVGLWVNGDSITVLGELSIIHSRNLKGSPSQAYSYILLLTSKGVPAVILAKF
jgi:hypothetical protein